MLRNRSMPRSTVIPEFAYPSVLEAADWLCTAFGFTLRIGMGSHRAQLNVGDGAVVLTELRTGRADSIPLDDQSRSVDFAHSVMVRIDDVDLHYERARQASARILRPPANYPYGERQYTAEDFAGHRWTFSQSVADIDPTEWGGIPGNLE